MSKPESEFPTIRDAHEVLAELIASGLGDLPVQVIVAPDSTMQALGRHAGATDDTKPALLIEFIVAEGRHPVTIVSIDRMDGSTRRSAVQ